MVAAEQVNDDAITGEEVVLASRLVNDEELDELLDGVCGVSLRKSKDDTKLLRTGVNSLDDALDGGVQSGRVVGLSAEPGGGGSELCRTLLVGSLLKYDSSTVAVVDTTGNFDILRLYALILAQLKRNPGVLSSLRLSFDADLSVEDVAAKILDRVKIMRVFDFVGVTEAISEVREELDAKTVRPVEKEELENAGKAEVLPAVQAPPKRTVVADSEDEDSDEEMLFDSEATITQPAAPVQDPQKKEAQMDPGESPMKVKFILIDSLAHVLNPLLKKDYVKAIALATPFLLSLSTLTHTHALHTLLLNPTITPRTSSPSRPPLAPQPHQPAPQQQQPQPPRPPSIFASSTAVLSLMNLLVRLVDVDLLVTKVPRRKIDVRAHYSDGGGKKKGVEMVDVLEVVGDRWGGRMGAWGTFRLGEEGVGDV